jgi:thiol:disulfide interchange protein DsbD
VGALCIVFALSLLDIVRIPLPSHSGGRAGATPPGGIFEAVGIGMASGLVVGPCTAPVLGAILLFVASRQNVVLGMSLLFTFALGMGSLLVVLGTFSGFLAGLPKSGRWLVGVKKGFGVIMIAAGIYFIIQAGLQLA